MLCPGTSSSYDSLAATAGFGGGFGAHGSPSAGVSFALLGLWGGSGLLRWRLWGGGGRGALVLGWTVWRRGLDLRGGSCCRNNLLLEVLLLHHLCACGDDLRLCRTCCGCCLRQGHCLRLSLDLHTQNQLSCQNQELRYLVIITELGLHENNNKVKIIIIFLNGYLLYLYLL